MWTVSVNNADSSVPSGSHHHEAVGAGRYTAVSHSLTVPDDVAAPITTGDDSPVQQVTSPDGSITVTIDVSEGIPAYEIDIEGTTYLDASAVGFDFVDQPPFGHATVAGAPSLAVTGSERGTETETWTPEWGDVASVAADYEYLHVGLEESADPGRRATLQFRVFDDGLGFRLVFGDGFGEFTVTSENTEFNFAGDYTAWWIRNEFVNPRFEQEYVESRLSEIPAGTRTIRPNNNAIRTGAHTPLTIRADDETYLSVHESDLDDYASMSLAAQTEAGSERMAVELAPMPDGTKVTATAPHMTPWRTVQVGSSPGDLVESQLVPLLARERDDSVLPRDEADELDTSWMTPRKYIGIWWLMIAGSSSWEYISDEGLEALGEDPRAHIHGARTERMKRYLTFASQHGIDSVLAEGWNKGWDSYPGDGSGLRMSIADPYPDFDLAEVLAFGATLDDPVEMTMHNETAGNIVNYESEIERDIFGGYDAKGIRSIKNGYVSDPGLGVEGDGSHATHNQHCQLAVNHHRQVIKAAAKNRQLLEIHEGVKPTGEMRTYPNVAAREVVKAQEYDGFDALRSDVGRDHHVLLPFTRMLAGPTSYQPGIFDVTFNNPEAGQIQTTRAKQLAMYPTYLGGLQMLADRIEAYVDDSFRVGEFVQAQSGTLDGLIVGDRWRNAYGGHYVPIDPSRESAGASVSFTVTDVPEAGVYDLHLRYAADAEETVPQVVANGRPEATLYVNGSRLPLTPPFTDDWDDWAVYTVPVELDAGDNTLTVELGEDDVGGINLNSVAVGEAGDPSPVAAAYEDVDPSVENFETVPEFEFLENVPTTWDETRVLEADIGEYVVVAKRSGEEWFLGAMTGEHAHDVDVTFDFLDDRAGGWTVTRYADAEGTDVDTNPTAVDVDEFHLTSGESVTVSMGASGGTAMHLHPAEE